MSSWLFASNSTLWIGTETEFPIEFKDVPYDGKLCEDSAISTYIGAFFEGFILYPANLCNGKMQKSIYFNELLCFSQVLGRSRIGKFKGIESLNRTRGLSIEKMAQIGS